MKRLIGVFVLIALFALPAFGQGIVGVKSHDYGTVANSVNEAYVSYTWSGLLKEFGCNKIDSLIISITVQNETDIDSVMWYPCNWTTKGTAVNGTVRTFVSTLDVAANATGTAVLYVANAGVASVLWRGYEGFRVFTRGAAAGNDPTDPNNLKITFTFYGS